MQNTKYQQEEGKVDGGLFFAAGLFFLVLALVTLYVSHFGLSPLPKKMETFQMADLRNMSAATAFAVLEPVTSSTTPSTPNGSKNEEFFASLTKTPVKEIYIGSYGTIDEKILSALRDEVGKTFGVKTTLLAPGDPIPKEEPFYDKNRKQYDSDVLIKSIEQSSSPYGLAVRLLYVVDLNMDSFSGEPFSSRWFRVSGSNNAALISLQGLRAQNTQSPEEVPPGVLFSRVKKIALHALGLTVGFDSSPSVKDDSCIMHPPLILEDFDKQQDTFCFPETEAIPRVFVNQ